MISRMMKVYLAGKLTKSHKIDSKNVAAATENFLEYLD